MKVKPVQALQSAASLALALVLGGSLEAHASAAPKAPQKPPAWAEEVTDAIRTPPTGGARASGAPGGSSRSDAGGRDAQSGGKDSASGGAAGSSKGADRGGSGHGNGAINHGNAGEGRGGGSAGENRQNSER